MAATTETRTLNALVSSTLRNYKKTLEDNISTSNVFLYMLMKGGAGGGYRKITDLGEKMQVPLMYALGQGADSYNGYDTLNSQPTEGITSATFEWRQMAVPITISGRERKLNRGSEVKIFDLLEAKTQQATLAIEELFAKALWRGNAVNSGTLITPYVSPSNASSFIDPIPLLIKYDPTSSTTIGGINQSSESWWRNQSRDATGVTSYAGFLKALRKLRNDCSKGPGGGPDLVISTQGSSELYEAALAASHRNTSYQAADIPFDHVAFYGKPWAWDEFVPDVHTGTVAITKGSIFMFNMKYWGIKVDKETDFDPTPFVKPDNQDAESSHILWLGGSGVSNRRKQGVMGNVDETIAS